MRATLIARITDVAPAVRKLFDVRPSAEERATWMSLTAHQLEALSALYGGKATMGALCERLDISESAGTALCDRLVSQGMVVRASDPTDRRVVLLSLSEDARAMVARFRKLKRKRIAEVLSALGDDELEALAGVYERLVASHPGDRGARHETPNKVTSKNPTNGTGGRDRDR
jgi:DNA-binding MarR family transcriptional regulator